MSEQRPSCRPPSSLRQAVSQVDHVALVESPGGHPRKSKSTVHFFNGQARTRATDTSFNWTQLDPIAPSDVVAIEIVDLFLPIVKSSVPGYVYIEISINNNPLEHVMFNGRWFTAAIPTMFADSSRVSMKYVCGERVIIHFLDQPVRAISSWSMRAYVFNTTTGAFEFYPLPDDLDFVNNVAFKAECLRYA